MNRPSSIQQVMIDFLDLKFYACRKSDTGKSYMLCMDPLNNNATYAYQEDATAQQIFDHTASRRKAFVIEINCKDRPADVACAA